MKFLNYIIDSVDFIGKFYTKSNKNIRKWFIYYRTNWRTELLVKTICSNIDSMALYDLV